MALKSLAEIAFDAFQTFADDRRTYTNNWNLLVPEEKLVFERIADRVYAEVLMRQNPDQKTVAMPDLDKDHE